MKSFAFKFPLAVALLLMAIVVSAQDVYQTIGVIGTATANGWNSSTPLQLANASDPHQWTGTLQLVQGEVKFRANDDWGVNWGGYSFPAGTGERNGPNINVSTSSYYTVTFNDVTGVYNFQSSTPPLYATVGIIGNATAGGWDASTPMTQDSFDPHLWTMANVALTQGEVKFRANNSWDVNWGGSSFPSGTALQNGPNITVSGGDYNVTFNDVTLEYYFENVNPAIYETVGIIGTATAGGWDASTAMKLVSSGDPNNWILTTFLTAGELKFRANNSWDVNWGGNNFPSGTSVPNGANLQIPESSYYTIRFNDVSLSYSFTKLTPTSYETVGIIGTATTNGWDSSTALVKGSDGHTWTLANISLFSGEAKFRANNAWETNWGASSFPTGTGVQNGPNIPIPAGTYNVSFNDVTGEYDFTLTGGPVGGIVVLEPAYPTADESVTIIYDANQGVSGLRNAEKVYMHSGIILSGPDGTSWNNVVGNWGQDDGIGEMTRLEGEANKWKITLPSIRSYYGAGNVPIFRLGMVFRNAAGTQTGKSETNNDIFVDIDAGDFVRFITPTATQVFGVAGETLTIAAEASETASSITVELNEGNGYQLVTTVANSQQVNYNYTFGSATTLSIRITASLDDATVVSEKSISIVLRQPNVIAALPAGLKNGINYQSDDPTKATLVLLAPHKQFVFAIGDFSNWQLDNNYQMKQTPDGEYFWLELTGLEPGKEYVYQYWVEGTIKIGDPYADKVADPIYDANIPASVYPNPVPYNRTQDGIATVLQTGQSPYQWNFSSVQGGRPDKENLVVYELLLRDFLGSHSYEDLADTLSYLKRLGVNAIELLPIMEFEGNESWGYNPSYLFAPDKYYGTKNRLKAFIDKAHEEGFVVILDMVLNHQFGQSPMVRMYWDEANGKPSPQSPWFNPDATHPYNVGYDFNHESAYTKRYVDDVNRYWLEEFHFDGFRFDLSKGFTQTNNPNDVGAWSAYDQSRIDILKRMTDKIRETDPSAYVIMEHLAVNDEEKVLADYGIMLWGNMNGAYSNVVNGNTATNLDATLSATRQWNEKNLVPYMESHDEERLMVRALNSGAVSGDYSIRQIDVALERIKLASAFFYTLPGPKMLWQFGELGYDVSIDFNGRTGNKPIPWGEEDGLKYNEDPARIKLYKTTAAINKLVNDHTIVFEQGDFTWTPTGQFRKISITHPAMNVIIIGNFGTSGGTIDPPFQHPGTWYDYFAGRSFTVTTTSTQTVLEAGEFHIYVDQPVIFPERGLLNRTEIFPPENLVATIDSTTVELVWEDTSTGESGFELLRKSENDAAFDLIATLNPEVTSYVDQELIDGVTYQYKIRTVSDLRPASEWSNVVNADLALIRPTLLSVTQSKKSLVVTWSDGSNHETAYVLERSDAQKKGIPVFEVVAVLPANAVSFVDNNVKNGVEYTYRVFCRDNDETSMASNVAAIRVGKDKASSVTFYPNPSATLLTVRNGHDRATLFQIISLKGRVMESFQVYGGSEKQIDVSAWSEGLYLLRSDQVTELVLIKR